MNWKIFRGNTGKKCIIFLSEIKNPIGAHDMVIRAIAASYLTSQSFCLLAKYFGKPLQHDQLNQLYIADFAMYFLI